MQESCTQARQNTASNPPTLLPRSNPKTKTKNLKKKIIKNQSKPIKPNTYPSTQNQKRSDFASGTKFCVQKSQLGQSKKHK